MANQKLIGYHISGWIVYLLIIAMGADEIDAGFIAKNISTLLPVIAVFYINTGFIFPRYLKKGKYAITILLSILACVLTISLRVLYMKLNRHNLGPVDGILFWTQFRMNFLFTGISFAYWYAVKNYKDEKKWAQLEKENADARLDYLKHQVNPHFLYNALSLLYSKTLPLSDEASALVGKISDMLRYSLDESEGRGTVPLDKELAHIQNYIDIHQLRFNNTLAIRYTVCGDTSRIRVPPMLLITFVENAFKHGKFNEPEQPLTITLEIKADDLVFFVKNRKAVGTKALSGGIGLQNVKSRLALLYPASHSLAINEDDQFYTIQLTIRSAI